jgi:hypothetical protein
MPLVNTPMPNIDDLDSDIDALIGTESDDDQPL